ncbi:hypothetical protein [Lentzea sp. HUAS12]|uniref:hypothetical protein n=1 Tax=Lentzea sp. HUAS12 TaxID=2951806 RepID=UPI00209DA003|nr:hypothetical protein [Lentzea sp. HUAS12]USX56389.1 hypothetical protein ND450_20495 [Lentzea sp. HUAS12]
MTTHPALRARTASGNGMLSVLATATRLGLANTTFSRRFPDLVSELAQHHRTGTATAAATGGYTELQQQNRRLRAELQVAGGQLELALARVQRLAEDKQQLMSALERAHAVRVLRNQT